MNCEIPSEISKEVAIFVVAEVVHMNSVEEVLIERTIDCILLEVIGLAKEVEEVQHLILEIAVGSVEEVVGTLDLRYFVYYTVHNDAAVAAAAGKEGMVRLGSSVGVDQAEVVVVVLLDVVYLAK